MSNASKKSDNDSFEENFKKLSLLSEELQQNKVSIDQLVPRIKEALTALRACKEVLKETKLQLNQVSSEFAELDAEAAD